METEVKPKKKLGWVVKLILKVIAVVAANLEKKPDKKKADESAGVE